MYVVKGSWVGQTFALATTSDSGGRKARIRRSKEERKAMVESFIQRYQSSNDGNFPSLNLTHKEVGGSFYTVREIVTEIIQENRVLGPARYNPEVDHDDVITTMYPLGSIASEPQSLLCHETDKLNVNSKNLERESIELPLDDNGHYINYQEVELSKYASEYNTHEMVKNPNVLISNHAEHGGSKLSLNSIGQHLNEDEIDTSGFMNGVMTNEISSETGKREATYKLSDETGEREAAQLRVSEILDADTESAVIGASLAQPRLPIEEVIVEKFPLRPANKKVDDSAKLPTESGSLSGTLSNSKTKQTELSSGLSDAVQSSSFVISYDPVITEGTTTFENSISVHGCNGESGLEVNGEVSQCVEGEVITAVADTGDSPLIEEGSPVHNGDTYQIASQNGLVSKTSEQLDDQLNNAPTRAMCFEARNGTSSKTNDGEPHFAALNGIDIHRDNKAVSANSPPVDRINLQSWEKAALKQQPNPLLAVFKAFVDAVVKFWS